MRPAHFMGRELICSYRYSYNVYEIANWVRRDALLLNNNNGINFSSALCWIIKGNLISFLMIPFVCFGSLLATICSFSAVSHYEIGNRCYIGGLLVPKIRKLLLLRFIGTVANIFAIRILITNCWRCFNQSIDVAS